MARFKPNRGWAKEVVRGLQKDLDKQGPVTIPVQYETPDGERAAGYTVNNYNGPTVYGDVNNSVLAWGNNSVDVSQHNTTEQIASGFEDIAEAVADTLRRLPDLGLTDDERTGADTAAREVLAEVTKETPDPGLIRKGATLLKGFLASVAMGVQTGVTAEAQAQAQQAIQALGASISTLG